MYTEFVSIEDAITSAVQSAWGVTVLVGLLDPEPAAPFAVVRLVGTQEVVNQTPITDEVMYSFEIAGRFALAGGGRPQRLAMERANQLKVALYLMKNPGGVGYMPQITGVNVEQIDVQDGTYDVLVNYTVRAIVTR